MHQLEHFISAFLKVNILLLSREIIFFKSESASASFKRGIKIITNAPLAIQNVLTWNIS